MVGTGNAAVVAQQDGEHRSWQPAGWRRWDKAPSLLWAGGQGGTGRGRVVLVVVVVVHDHDVTGLSTVSNCWRRDGRRRGGEERERASSEQREGGETSEARLAISQSAMGGYYLRKLL